MIEFDQIFCEDLRDDFEEAGIKNKLFTLEEFIQNDLSRAFALGYCINQWVVEKLWIPPSIRKSIRHISDNLCNYNSQLSWINQKRKFDNIEEYADFVLTNMFYNSEKDKIKVAIALGMSVRTNKDESKEN